MLAAARDEVVSTAATEQLGLRMRTGRHAVIAGGAARAVHGKRRHPRAGVRGVRRVYYRAERVDAQPLQHLHRRRMQLRRCRRHAVAAGFGRAAVPGRHHAAGVFDDRDQRRDVDVLERRLGDEVDVAGGEQAIAVAVEAPAGLQRRGAQPGDVGGGAGLLEDVGRGGGHLGAA